MSRHCVAVVTIADGGQEVNFYKESTITNSQNAKGLSHFVVAQIYQTGKPCGDFIEYQKLGGKKEIDWKTTAKMACEASSLSGGVESGNAHVCSDHFVKGKVT